MTKFCVKELHLCDKVVCVCKSDKVVCEGVMAKSCVYELCVTKLCVKEFCVAKLCERVGCARVVRDKVVGV